MLVESSVNISDQIFIRIIHLVRTENFAEKENLLPPDTHIYVCVSGGKKC